MLTFIYVKDLAEAVMQSLEHGATRKAYFISVLFLSPKLFEEAWFERGIAEFGQATGVTATGLLLLRTVDPENKTVAAASFAGKQLINEPVMGVWVAVALALVFTIGWMPVWIICTAVLLFWLIVAVVLIRRRK